LSNTEAIVLSVEKGLGLGFSPKIIASQIGDVVAIPIKGLKIEVGLTIIRDMTQLTTAARDAFWDYMSSVSEALQDSLASN
jgi:hypothetical protein